MAHCKQLQPFCLSLLLVPPASGHQNSLRVQPPLAPRSSRESYFVLPGSLWMPSLAEGHGKAPCPTKRVSPGSLRSPELIRARPRRTRGQLSKPPRDPLGLGQVARLGLAALQTPNPACSRRSRSWSSRRVLTRSCRSRTRRAELGLSVRSTLRARRVALTRDDAPRGSAFAEHSSPQLNSGERPRCKDAASGGRALGLGRPLLQGRAALGHLLAGSRPAPSC